MPQTTTQNYLGRCQECDYVIFATAEDVQAAEGFRDVTAGTGVYRVGHRFGTFARCTNRHKVFPCKLVKGTYSKDHQCDSRCLNAKGWECTCSCGGANHGRGHVATVVQASDLPPNGVMDEPTWAMREQDRTVPSTEPRYAERYERRVVPHTVEDYRRSAVHPSSGADTTGTTAKLKHLGSPGMTITGEVFVKSVKSLDNGSVLYSFRTVSNGDHIKWFVPGHADPGFEVASTIKIRARVKRHDEFMGAPETIVTYVEEVE
jgi:hypothetical protein